MTDRVFLAKVIAASCDMKFRKKNFFGIKSFFLFAENGKTFDWRFSWGKNELFEETSFWKNRVSKLRLEFKWALKQWRMRDRWCDITQFGHHKKTFSKSLQNYAPKRGGKGKQQTYSYQMSWDIEVACMEYLYLHKGIFSIFLIALT